MSQRQTPPEDEAIIDLIARHKAEWADYEAKREEAMAAERERLVAESVAMLRQGKPSRRRVAVATRRIARWMVRQVRQGRVEARKIAARHAREMEAALAARSGKRIKLPIMSQSEIQKRVAKETAE